jgi:hypothetical protein
MLSGGLAIILWNEVHLAFYLFLPSLFYYVFEVWFLNEIAAYHPLNLRMDIYNLPIALRFMLRVNGALTFS